MTQEIKWTTLAPPFQRRKWQQEAFISHARKLSRLPNGVDQPQHAETKRSSFVQAIASSRKRDCQMLLAAGHVLTDLAAQGWSIRVRRGLVQARPPAPSTDDVVEEKRAIRRQELIQRDNQLREPSVRTFVRAMERSRLFRGQFVSIFSLFRDGRELASRLRRARSLGQINLLEIVDPYIQFVSEDATCDLTGLRLMDIWRYFRHTWTTPHRSTPGRRMMLLVRDRAAEFHPVVGIAAIVSPVVQLGERDRWIGWDAGSILKEIEDKPDIRTAKWLCRTLADAIDEIFVDDFLEDALLTRRALHEPDAELVDRLLREAEHQRSLHHRYSRAKDHKDPRANRAGPEHWEARARTHLFRSKRAGSLATLLRSRIVLNREFDSRPTREKLIALTSTKIGRDVIVRLTKKAKADRIGVSVADLSVCGAVPPYGPILGGKLISVLAASPEVVAEYRRRYRYSESEIASSMAGRAIVRSPELVLLTTSSLYGTNSSQYNRIKLPCKPIGGCSGDNIQFEKLGRSEAFGTSHYAPETVRALTRLLEQTAHGQRVNSVFGEGVSPRLRKVREGLDHLSFSSAVLLRHYRKRIVYGVPLARNFREYLRGRELKPDYLVPPGSADATEKVVGWWMNRWLRPRIQSNSVLEQVAQHTLERPIRHGARVSLPKLDDEERIGQTSGHLRSDNDQSVNFLRGRP